MAVATGAEFHGVMPGALWKMEGLTSARASRSDACRSRALAVPLEGQPRATMATKDAAVDSDVGGELVLGEGDVACFATLECLAIGIQ